jgi:hypothetical protein
MDGLEYLTKQIVDRREQIAVALINGSAKTFDEYKYLAGEIRGLSFAEQAINDLVRKMEHDDDDDGES